MAAGGSALGAGSIGMRSCDQEHPCDSDDDSRNNSGLALAVSGSLAMLLGGCMLAIDPKPQKQALQPVPHQLRHDPTVFAEKQPSPPSREP